MTTDPPPVGARAVEWMNPAALRLNPRNARKHPKEQVDAIAESIRRFGFNAPLLVDAENTILAGHGRYLAARVLGADSVPVIRLAHLDPEQARGYLIADNRLSEMEGTGWDWDILRGELTALAADGTFDLRLVGFSAEDLTRFGAPVERVAPPGALKARFGWSPFSVLDSRRGEWQSRRREWLGLGIESEQGREHSVGGKGLLFRASSQAPEVYDEKREWERARGRAGTWKEFFEARPKATTLNSTSIFDPVLTELLVRWFSPRGGLVLDPFAGGSVRGIVSAVLGRNYLGVELRPDQVAANRRQWDRIRPKAVEPVRPDVEFRGGFWVRRGSDGSRAGVPTIPGDAKRIVVPVRTGRTVCEVLWGLADQGRQLPVFGVAVGPGEPVALLADSGPPGWDRAFDWDRPAPAAPAVGFIGDLEIHPDDARCLPYLREGDVLWLAHTDAVAGAAAEAHWIVGDALDCATIVTEEADLVLSCPPYGDLEVYSDDPRDLSFIAKGGQAGFFGAYAKAVAAACSRLKEDRFAAFVVSDYRIKNRGYAGLIPATVRAFADAGLAWYNDAVLINNVSSLAMRAGAQFSGTRKLGRCHQNVLVFVKGDPARATKACGSVDVEEALNALAEGNADATLQSPDE